MKNIIYTLFLVCAVLVSCKKEQPEMHTMHQGCDCAHEVSADFVMEELTTPNPNFVQYTSTDTIYADKNVRFRALENDAEYTWIIGSEVIHEQEVTRYFGTDLSGDVIPIQLIVKKKANTICFPNDDGVDTVTKYLVVGPEFDDYGFYNDPYPRFEGTYRMKDVNSSDSIDIQIDARPFYPPFTTDAIVIRYCNEEEDSIAVDMQAHNYRQYFFWGSGYGPTSTWYYDLNGTYELKLEKEELSTKPNKHYFGRKIN